MADLTGQICHSCKREMTTDEGPVVVFCDRHAKKLAAGKVLRGMKHQKKREIE